MLIKIYWCIFFNLQHHFGNKNINITQIYDDKTFVLTYFLSSTVINERCSNKRFLLKLKKDIKRK